MSVALGRAATTEPETGALAAAIVRAVVYADLFDHPLQVHEIHRYLVRRRASLAEVGRALDQELPAALERTGRYVHLRARRHIVATRERRIAASALLWRDARRYGHAVARLPLVRGVLVSGALAMDNAEADSDIDLFVLAQPGRVWTCRLLAVAVVRIAAGRGVRLCPNFVLSTDRLALARRDLFTAHEIAQLVPLLRTPWSDAFFEANAWTRELLPNALPSPSARRAHPSLAARAASGALGSRLFGPIERWEMARKVRRLEARARREGGSVAFTRHECRGHFAAHDVRILSAFAARAAEVEAPR